MMDDIFIFVKPEEVIVRIAEGDGSNLSQEDIDNGYFGYLYYDIYSLEEEIIVSDGGIMLLDDSIANKYQKTKDIILDVLEFAFDNREIPYTVLKK